MELSRFPIRHSVASIGSDEAISFSGPQLINGEPRTLLFGMRGLLISNVVPADTSLEKHYRVGELVALWHIGRGTARKLAMQRAIEEMDLKWTTHPLLLPTVCCPECGETDSFGHGSVTTNAAISTREPW